MAGSDLAAVEELLDEQRDRLTPPRADLAAAAVASLTRWTHHYTVDLADPEHARTWL